MINGIKVIVFSCVCEGCLYIYVLELMCSNWQVRVLSVLLKGTSAGHILATAGIELATCWLQDGVCFSLCKLSNNISSFSLFNRQYLAKKM